MEYFPFVLHLCTFIFSKSNNLVNKVSNTTLGYCCTVINMPPQTAIRRLELYKIENSRYTCGTAIVLLKS